MKARAFQTEASPLTPTVAYTPASSPPVEKIRHRIDGERKAVSAAGFHEVMTRSQCCYLTFQFRQLPSSHFLTRISHNGKRLQVHIVRLRAQANGRHPHKTRERLIPDFKIQLATRANRQNDKTKPQKVAYSKKIKNSIQIMTKGFAKNCDISMDKDQFSLLVVSPKNNG